MSNWTKFTAGEDLKAGDMVLLNEEGLAVKADAESESTFIMRQKVKTGKQFAFPTDELPGTKQEPDAQEPEQPAEAEIAAVTYPEKPGYEYRGTDGKGNYYYTNASGAYTLKTSGQFTRVGNRFDAKFLESLKR